MASSHSVLVTGATGFVGSVLTRQLVDAGTDVRIFRRDTSSLDLLGTYAERVDHAVGDLRRARSLYEAMQGVDRVYHVAAKVSFARGDRAAVRRVNADGTAHVVNAALKAGVDRLVHTSSIAALGRPPEPDGAIDETTEWQGLPHRSAYARSKRRAELEVHRGIAEGLDATLVNPSLVFGVGGPETNTRRIVDAVRSGWLLAVPPGGTNVVDVRGGGPAGGDAEGRDGPSLLPRGREPVVEDARHDARGRIWGGAAPLHDSAVASTSRGHAGRGRRRPHPHAAGPRTHHGPNRRPHLPLRQQPCPRRAWVHVPALCGDGPTRRCRAVRGRPDAVAECARGHRAWGHRRVSSPRARGPRQPPSLETARAIVYGTSAMTRPSTATAICCCPPRTA